MKTNRIDYPNGIFTLDSAYVRARHTAVHGIVHQGRVALIDTATRHSLPIVLSALSDLGLSPAAVDYIFLTHIHLDHAGGAGAYMAAFPNATLVVHPRGVRHMVEPSKLLAGVTAVYGPERTQALYAPLTPVPAARILAAEDGGGVSLAGRWLKWIDTPGHARHHIAIWDEQARALFTGDTFGLSYRELDVAGRTGILPTTTPSQFEPQALHDTVRKLAALEPEWLYLSHFGGIRYTPGLEADFHRLLKNYVAIAQRAGGEGEARQTQIHEGLRALMWEEAQRQGWLLCKGEMLAILDQDLELNAQGLNYWLTTLPVDVA